MNGNPPIRRGSVSRGLLGWLTRLSVTGNAATGKYAACRTILVIGVIEIHLALKTLVLQHADDVLFTQPTATVCRAAAKPFPLQCLQIPLIV